MYVVRVKDRGRDLAWHRVEDAEAAQEIRRVYELLGYATDKIVLELIPEEQPRVAA